jgi:hypothetical protein
MKAIPEARLAVRKKADEGRFRLLIRFQRACKQAEIRVSRIAERGIQEPILTAIARRRNTGEITR